MPSGKCPCTFINTSHTLLLEKARRCIWPFNSDRPFVCLCRHSCDKPQTWCHCRSYGREIENFCQCCPFSLEPQAVSEGGVITDLSGWRFFCDFASTYLYIHLHKTLKAIDRGYWKKSFQISGSCYLHDCRWNGLKSTPREALTEFPLDPFSETIFL